MARHRNVRSMKYEDDYDYDDVYGQSYEDDYCISPGTAAQFTFDRSRAHQLDSFMTEVDRIPEEDEYKETQRGHLDEETDSLQDSGSYQRPHLPPNDEAKLNSCLEEMRNIVGESTPEHIMVDAVLKSHFNFEVALNSILNAQDAPKPQRKPRERSNRGDKVVTDSATDHQVAPELTVAPPTGHGRLTFTIDDKVNGISAQPKHSEPSKTSKESSKIHSVPTTEELSCEGTSITGEEPSRIDDEPSRIDDGPSKTCDALSRTSLNTKDVVKASGVDGLKECEGGGKDGGDITPKKAPSSGSSSTPSSLHKSASKVKLEKLDLQTEYEKRKSEGKDYINLVVIGHVDAGKSTLMGHLLFQLGFVNKRTLHKYEVESSKLGKASFAYAWVLDETEEERARGITMDIAQTRFETSSKIVTLLDAPGHKDFIPNMITGAAQADVAVLVVNSTRGEFETGFETGGQTREHAMLVRSLGVSQLLVAVNKMDTVEWSLARYQEVTAKLGSFLKQSGFRDADVTYVPCSGLSGENLSVAPSQPQLLAWYTGISLVEGIDQFRPPDRLIDKPFRLCVSDVFKGMGSGFSVAGTVQTGSVQLGERILISPQSDLATVKGLQIDESPVQVAFAGDSTVLTITGTDINNIGLGSVLCDPSQPIRASCRIRARVVVFNVDLPITKGFPVVLHYQSLSEPAIIRKLVSQLHKTTGQVIKKGPRCLVRNTSGELELIMERSICVELYKDFRDLGRITLRYKGSTIAAGLVTEILDKKAGKSDT